MDRKPEKEFSDRRVQMRRLSLLLPPPPSPLLLLLLLLLRWPRAADAMYEDWGELRAGISKHAEEGKAQKGGWRCGVCGEVVSTYRDSAACDDASAEGGVSCGLSSRCDQFDTPARRASCQDVRRSFRESESAAQTIVNGLAGDVEPFELCVELGKCQAQVTAEGSKCFTALNTARCGLDPICPTGADACDDACLSCAWLVRTWPLFSGKCKDAALGRGGAVGAPTSATKKMLLRRRLLGKPAPVGLGSPPNDPDPQTPKSQDELAEYCYETWDLLEKDPKARYISASTDQLGAYPWSADLACKCLRRCPFDEFEALKLVTACDFVDQTSDLTNAVYPNLATKRNARPDSVAADYFEGSSLLRT